MRDKDLNLEDVKHSHILGEDVEEVERGKSPPGRWFRWSGGRCFVHTYIHTYIYDIKWEYLLQGMTGAVPLS
jgi:hypothetical protein